MKKIVTTLILCISTTMISQITNNDVVHVTNASTSLRQQDPCSQIIDNGYQNAILLGGTSNQFAAIDFDVTANESFVISQVKPTMAFSSDSVEHIFDIVFYDDDGGLPGVEIVTITDISSTSFEDTMGGSFLYREHTLDLPDPQEFLGGENGTKYWLEFRVDTDVAEIEFTFPSEVIGQRLVFKNNAGGQQWQLATIGNIELAYEIIGECNPTLDVGDSILNSISIFPNPTLENIFVKVPENISIDNIGVFDILGKKLPVGISNGKIDMKNLPTGMYIIKIETKYGVLTEQIVKR